MRDWAQIVGTHDFNVIAQATTEWRTEKGFETGWHNLSEKLMLIMTEVSEACDEAQKAGTMLDRFMFPSLDWRTNMTDFACVSKNYCEEWVDAMVRILDIAGSLRLEMPAVYIGEEIMDLFSTITSDSDIKDINEVGWFEAFGSANATATIFVLREMSRAMEVYRDVVLSEVTGEPVLEQLEEKKYAIGVCLHRALHACVTAIRVVGEEWVGHYREKMEKNELRPRKHGRQR